MLGLLDYKLQAFELFVHLRYEMHFSAVFRQCWPNKGGSAQAQSTPFKYYKLRDYIRGLHLIFGTWNMLKRSGFSIWFSQILRDPQSWLWTSWVKARLHWTGPAKGRHAFSLCLKNSCQVVRHKNWPDVIGIILINTVNRRWLLGCWVMLGLAAIPFPSISYHLLPFQLQSHLA